MNQRVVFIGIDAADADLLDQWADAGSLPNWRRLRSQSLAIPTSAPPGVFVGAIWPCIYTGVNPARHGCHSWQQLRPGTYDLVRFYAGDSLRREPFWNVLGRAGKRVAIVDVPLTGPSQGLNGIQVVEWGCHDPERGLRTWPPGLARDLEARFGRHPTEGNCNAERGLREHQQYRDRLVRGVAGKTRLSAYLYGQERWDFFATVFSESHCVGHQCYHLHDPKHEKYDAAIARRVGNPIADVYRAIDAGLGQLMELIDEDTTLLVLASHGLGPHYDGCFLLPTILQRLGLMDGSGELARQRAFPIKNNCVSGAIRVNLVGREPQGLVRPGREYDDFCGELIQELHSLVNLETGTPLVREVLYARDLFRGAYLDHLPDLFVEWDHRFPVREISSPRVGTIRDRWKGCRTGDHKPNGLLLAHGPGVMAGRLGRTVSVMDLAPTMAACLGVPLPDVDGRAIQEVAAPETMIARAAA
jgi:predicted AlkP superfamily phosphohydrolase/phosphomutase